MSYIKTVDNALEFIKTQYTNLEKKLSDDLPKIQQLNELPTVLCRVYISDAFKYTSGIGVLNEMTTIEQLDKRLEEWKVKLDASIAEIKRIHFDVNVPIIENNKLVAEKVRLMMVEMGFPKSTTKSYFKTNRSRERTHETINAGWVNDIATHCSTTDPYEYTINQENSAFESIKQVYVKKKQAILEDQKKQTEAKKKIDSDRNKAFYQVKYGLTPDSDWFEIRETIEEECKYLALASALQANREDWNDGYDLASNALYSFKVETAEDQKIYDCIYDIIMGDDVDGRYFRDCKYNYDYLFSKVDPELLKDHNAVSEFINAY